MRIFALQTNRQKTIERFCHAGECIVLATNYHSLSFLFAILKDVFITIGFFTAGVLAWIYGLPMVWVLSGLAIAWFVFVFFNVLKAYIDWYYDMIVVTSDKVILIDQTSIFKQVVNPIHIENIGGITTATQFLDLFPFGAITFQLKEGLGGEDIQKKYVPNHKQVSEKISTVVTRYQRGDRIRQDEIDFLHKASDYNPESWTPVHKTQYRQEQGQEAQHATPQPPQNPTPTPPNPSVAPPAAPQTPPPATPNPPQPGYSPPTQNG